MAQNKRRPGTGDKRKSNQPLKIDRLPVEVRDAIQFLKNTRGKTWQEIEELSSLPYNAKWQSAGGGFVPWEELPTPVLELFPDLRLPHSNLHRWYDIRVDQVTRETLARSAQAQALAKAFAKSVVKRDDQAVLNAARDQLMSLLAEDASPDSRLLAAKGLISLAQKMQASRLNDLRERKVEIDERQVKVAEKTLQMKLDAVREKAEALIGDLENAGGKKAASLTPEQLLQKVREIYGAA